MPVDTIVNPRHRTSGCARCRMDLIRFTREVRLPRFTMRAGEEWNLPQTSYRTNRYVELGAGLVPPGAYELVERDAQRASHNGRACPGAALDLETYPDALLEYVRATPAQAATRTTTKRIRTKGVTP
jgi:hypothetical protein